MNQCCSVHVIKEKHNRTCEACGMTSATLYELSIVKLTVNICCFCKSSIREDIQKLDGPDGY